MQIGVQQLVHDDLILFRHVFSSDPLVPRHIPSLLLESQPLVEVDGIHVGNVHMQEDHGMSLNLDMRTGTGETEKVRRDGEKDWGGGGQSDKGRERRNGKRSAREANT
mmetsp:Transcript_45694/g.143429  ORF Transcript_45694/g.143429 Transcript_45694/m.143429 type:complete len:108 (-) Transcript_45694:715-1038(-)